MKKQHLSNPWPLLVIFVLLGALLVPLAHVGAEGSFRLFFPLVGNSPDRLAAGHLMITEVLHYEDVSGGEWIELFNAGREQVNLRAYKIGDEEVLGGSEGMLQFPIGAGIAPGEVIVIAEDALVFESIFGFLPDYEFSDSGSTVPDMVKYAAWAGGSINLVNSGDEVLLLDLYDDLVDAVSWGSSNWAFDPDVAPVSSGQSIERVPGYADTDTAGDWIRQPAPTPGRLTDALPSPSPAPSPTPAPTAVPGVLMIHEVMYHPPGEEPGSEWFEIYNDSGFGIDLTGYKIGDEEQQGGSEGMYAFPDGAQIPARGVWVIAVDAAAFRQVYNFLPDFELMGTDPSVPDMVKYSAWAVGRISLGNTGDELLLLDQADRLVDAVSWGSSNWAFNPGVSLTAVGYSLERQPPRTDTDTASDWLPQREPTPGIVGLRDWSPAKIP